MNPAPSLRRRTPPRLPTALLTAAILLAAGLGEGSASEADAEQAAVRLRYSTGFDYSQGDFGLDEDSRLFFVPVGVTADYERWRFRLVVPFLVSDGPSLILEGDGVDPSTTLSDENSGMGEIAVSASYLVSPPIEGWPLLDLGLSISLPTRTKLELGTGGWAFAPRVELFERYGRVTPYAAFGRKFFTVGSLDDRFFTSVGASFEILDWLSFGSAYDWLEATGGNTSDAHEITPYLSISAPGGWSFSPYGLVGLSEGAPDFGVGFSLSLQR